MFVDPTGLDIYYYTNSEFVANAEKDARLLEKEYGEPVHVLIVNTPKAFHDEWELMGNLAGKNVTVSLVVIGMHGEAGELYTNKGMQPVDANKLFPKYIGTILILACEVGNLKQRYDSFANKVLRRNTVNSVIAVDGVLHSPKINPWFINMTGNKVNYWVNEREMILHAIVENNGFIKYTKKGAGELVYEKIGWNFNGIVAILKKAGFKV